MEGTNSSGTTAVSHLRSVIPETLRERKQWMLWLNENGTKVPKQLDGTNAKSNDPSTWTTFDRAVEAEHVYSGLAIAISPDDLFTGIDLDGCLDEEGNLREWAVPIVSRFDGVAYGEVSPSGKGMKLLTWATKPTGARCKQVIAEGKQQIECYDHDRFWTMTGIVFTGGDFTSIEDGQEAVNWLCETYLKQEAGERGDHSARVQQSDLLQRGMSYLKGVPNVGEGGRNQATFSLAGNLAALEDGYGQRMSEGEIASLVVVWNFGNQPPLEENELRKAVHSALVNGTPREPKGPQPVDDRPVDLTNLINHGSAAAVPPQFHAIDQPKLEPIPEPDFEVGGFIGEMMQETLDTSPYPNEALAFLGALCLQSCLCGRKVCDENRNFSNIYTVALANSGVGKDHPRRRNAMVLQSLNMLDCLGDGVASGQGLEDAMYRTPNMLFQMDEFDQTVLAAVNQSKDSIASVLNGTLLKFYSHSASVYSLRLKANEDERRQITHPHLTVFATCTPTGFFENLNEKNIRSGLLPRTIILEAGKRGEGQDHFGAALSFGITSKAAEWLAPGENAGNLETINPTPIVVPHDADAQQLFQDLRRRADSEYDSAQAAGDDSACAIWSRTAENARKLALLHACSEMGKKAIVTRPAADWAISFSMRQTRWLLSQLERMGGDSDFEKRAQKFLDRLRKLGGREKRSELLHFMKCDVQDFDKLVKTLIERREIYPGELKTSGRTATLYLLSSFLPQAEAKEV